MKIFKAIPWVAGFIILTGWYGGLAYWMISTIDNAIGDVCVVAVYGGAYILSAWLILNTFMEETGR